MLFDSLIKLIMGINQLFFNRANINFGNAIVQVNGQHRTTPAYSAWSFSQLYGAAIVENSGLAQPKFKFEEPNVFLQENAEGNLEPIQYNNLMYALQLLQTYTICDIEHRQESIKSEKD